MELTKLEEFKNKLVKFWWTKSSDGKGNIDFDKVDGSNDFSIIPTNSKGIIQIHIGEFRSIIDEIVKQIKK